MKRWLWLLTYEAPRHITDPRLKGLPTEVVFLPSIPAYRTVRKWIWEK